MLRIHSLLAVLAILVLQSGCYRAVGSRCADVSAAGIESVHVDLANASIELVGDGETDVLWVEAHFEMLGVSRDAAEKAFEDVTLEIVTTGNKATVVMDTPCDVYATDMVLYVPDHLRSAVDTTNGEILVKDMRGDVDLDTTNGGIEITGSTGVVNAHTTNGRVLVEDHLGSVDASTTNGSVTLELVVPGGGHAYGDTTNGDVVLRIPDDTMATFDAATTHGNIHIDGLLFEGSWHDTEAHGLLNGGGTTEVRLDTTNGTIDVDGFRSPSDSTG